MPTLSLDEIDEEFANSELVWPNNRPSLFLPPKLAEVAEGWPGMVQNLLDASLVHTDTSLDQLEHQGFPFLSAQVIRTSGKTLTANAWLPKHDIQRIFPPGSTVNISFLEDPENQTQSQRRIAKGIITHIIPTHDTTETNLQITLNDKPEFGNAHPLTITLDTAKERSTLKKHRIHGLNFGNRVEDNLLLPPARTFWSGDFLMRFSESLPKKERLDHQQNKAFGRAMLYDRYPVLFIHGGPGAGKTTVTAEIIAGHLEAGRKVLMLSHSNKGAQVPALKLQEVIHKRQAASKTHVAGNLAEKVDPRLQKCRLKKGLPKNTPENKAAYQVALEKRKARFEESMEKGGVVVSTFGTLLNDRMIAEMMFDVVIVDEATRMRTPELIQALQKAGSQIIFVGDPLQLGNIPFDPQSEEIILDGLQNPHLSALTQEVRESIADYSEASAKRALNRMEDGPFTRAILETKYPERNLPYVFLDQNRRSLPNIVRVLSGLIYEGKLKPGRPPETDSENPEGRVQWIDTRHLEHQESSAGTSRKNPQEAELIVQKILNLVKGRGVAPEDIGVIATYKGQDELIRRRLKKTLCYNPDKPENQELYDRLAPNIATVDSFQGDERKVVLVSLTRSNREGHVGFLEEERRIGVAIGRAQDELYVYGNSETVVDRNTNPESKTFFGKMKALIEQYGKRTELLR